MTLYNASKGGAWFLTKSAALDCVRKGYDIRINAEPHLGRLGKSIEIANRAFYLVSDESNFSTISEFVAVLRNLKCHNRTRHYFGGVDFMFKAYKCYWQNAFKYKARST